MGLWSRKQIHVGRPASLTHKLCTACCVIKCSGRRMKKRGSEKNHLAGEFTLVRLSMSVIYKLNCALVDSCCGELFFYLCHCIWIFLRLSRCYLTTGDLLYNHVRCSVDFRACTTIYWFANIRIGDLRLPKTGYFLFFPFFFCQKTLDKTFHDAFDNGANWG